MLISIERLVNQVAPPVQLFAPFSPEAFVELTVLSETSSSALPAHRKAIDITAETCPMTYVRTRLALDALDTGEVLLVRLRGAEPLANVPRAAADQGHEPLDLIAQGDGSWLLVLKKG